MLSNGSDLQDCGARFPESSPMRLGLPGVLGLGLRLAIAGVFVPVLGAQSRPSIEADVDKPLRFTQSSPELPGKQDGKAARVSLKAKDRSIKFIIHQVARQAGLRMVYDDSDTLAGKRISVDFVNLPIKQAFAEVLKGTEMVAMIFDETGTVVLRRRNPRRDAIDSTNAVKRGRIDGKVIDSSSKEGIPGVTLTVVGTSLSITTKGDGSFSIDDIAPGEYNVAVRLIGYKSRQISVTIQSGRPIPLNVVLARSTTTLTEVVTTATGLQRRVEVPNDIARIDAAKIIERAPVRSLSDLLEAAQVPGVLVTRGSGDPGSPTKIRIRGLSSISQSNDPVVIVDGNWVDASMGSPSRIDDIDPSTIETIDIVRGPSAATLYGQDAANGVIVITTKKGKAGQTRWSTSYQRDWGQPYGTIPSAYVGLGHTTTAYGSATSCPILNILAYACIQDSVVTYNPNHRLLAREGTETNNRFIVQVDGGTNSVTYAITATASNTIGVRRVAPIDLMRFRILQYPLREEFNRPSALDRRTITSNLTMLPRQTLTLGLTVTGTQAHLTDNQIKPDYNLQTLGQVVERYNLDTTLAMMSMPNITRVENPSRTSSVLLGGTVAWRPNSGWLLNGNMGAQQNVEERSLYESLTRCNLIRGGCEDTVGRRGEKSRNVGSYTMRMNLSKALSLGSFSRFMDLRPSIGGDFRKTQTSQMDILKDQIPIGERAMVSGRLVNSTFTRFANATAGWYVNSNIGLFQRIYFDVGVRQDIGSAITSSSNSRYPKLGGSWLVSDESFWPTNSLVGLLRFRAALGHSAVQPDLADIHGSYVNGYEYIDGVFVRSVNLLATGNPKLKPERATELEMGFDIDLLGDRVSLIATYAHSENRNGLVSRTLPPSAGGATGLRKENIARLRNRDLELTAEARVVETRQARVVVNYGLTMRENLVTKLGNGIMPFSTNSVSRVQEGYPIAGVWAKRVIGYRDADQNGLLSANEIILSDSAAYLGWSQPRYQASYGTALTLNNQVTIDMRFEYKSQYVQNYTMENRYALEDANAPLAVQAYEVMAGRRPVSDMRWTSGSITYHVPGSVLRVLRARTLSVSLKGSNLGLWTNYAGRDPGVNSAILTSEVSVDNGQTVPQPRKYVLDFNLKF